MNDLYCLRTVCLSFSLIAITASADTHYVSLAGTNDVNGKYTNWAGAATQIQWAVDAAVDNDTVLVSNGTYNLTNQISIIKAITVQSFRGRSNTFVNGNKEFAASRCVFMENNSALVAGFCISNGGSRAIDGGGVYLSRGTLADCVVISNVGRYGGGIFIWKGTVTNCVVVNNISVSNQYATHGGGGICGSSSGYGSILNCDIISNIAVMGGGISLCAYQGAFMVKNCNISHNYASDSMSGGGVWFKANGYPVYMEHCAISGNQGVGNGGGIHVQGYYLNCISNCVVSHNTAGGNGGGYYDEVDYSLASNYLFNCLFSSNIASGASGKGGAVFSSARNVFINNCTIVSNQSAEGAGLLVTNLSANVVNCIIYFNGVQDAATSSFSYCCIQSTNGLTGTGNITNDPALIDLAGGNYRLNVRSPCVNTGSNQDWMTNSLDLDDRMRIRYGTVDMGAYETIYEGTIYRLGF